MLVTVFGLVNAKLAIFMEGIILLCLQLISRIAFVSLLLFLQKMKP